MAQELTTLFPMVQFKPDTWEIDEFDCASLFLLVGTERAMLIDCGMGIGDLKGAVEKITDKPLIVVVSHNHPDHTGNCYQFPEVYLHPKELEGRPLPFPAAKRREDIERISARQKGRLLSAFTMFRPYAFDLDVDLRDPAPGDPKPEFLPLYDGQKFDLGGGRIVTAYECPGHAPGEMMFLDEQTRSLFCGDALNYNLGISACPVETALRYLERMRDMGDQYDGIYNGHHDFRPLGLPLEDDCLPNAIDLCHQILNGTYSMTEVPNFWGSGRLRLGSAPVQPKDGPVKGFDMDATTSKMITKGRNFLGFNPNNIFEKK